MEDLDGDLFLSILEHEYESRLTFFDSIFCPGMSRAKHWCFTLNNYTDDDIQRIESRTNLYDYVVIGREVGASGTPHLQGFVSFPDRVRRNHCVDVIGQAHFTVARSIADSIRYCKKDGDFIELGVAPNGPGTRTDLEAFKTAVASGNLDMKKLRNDYSDIVAKYPKFCHDYVQDHIPQKTVEMFPLRPWQQALYDSLKQAPDSRSIFFIVDVTGNTGKTWFAHYYCFLNDNAQVLLPGKKCDMCYALQPFTRVLFVDVPRAKQGEFLQYDFLEDVKNGYVFSPKYESRIKHLPQCHVVVLMNEDPDLNKLSRDRYVIRRITDSMH